MFALMKPIEHFRKIFEQFFNNYMMVITICPHLQLGLFLVDYMSNSQIGCLKRHHKRSHWFTNLSLYMDELKKGKMSERMFSKRQQKSTVERNKECLFVS